MDIFNCFITVAFNTLDKIINVATTSKQFRQESNINSIQMLPLEIFSSTFVPHNEMIGIRNKSIWNKVFECTQTFDFM